MLGGERTVIAKPSENDRLPLLQQTTKGRLRASGSYRET
ncbi:hypothetical protein GGQ82_001376 [Sphingobium olei]